jgi:hypothetical protein
MWGWEAMGSVKEREMEKWSEVGGGRMERCCGFGMWKWMCVWVGVGVDVGDRIICGARMGGIEEKVVR